MHKKGECRVTRTNLKFSLQKEGRGKELFPTLFQMSMTLVQTAKVPFMLFLKNSTVGAESISLFSENCKFLKIVYKKVKYLGKKRFVSGYRST